MYMYVLYLYILLLYIYIICYVYYIYIYTIYINIYIYASKYVAVKITFPTDVTPCSHTTMIFRQPEDYPCHRRM